MGFIPTLTLPLDTLYRRPSPFALRLPVRGDSGSFFENFRNHFSAKMAPKIANLAEIIHLVPILATSWAQHRPTWSLRCPDKLPQDARIAKNLEKKPKEN